MFSLTPTTLTSHFICLYIGWEVDDHYILLTFIIKGEQYLCCRRSRQYGIAVRIVVQYSITVYHTVRWQGNGPRNVIFVVRISITMKLHEFHLCIGATIAFVDVLKGIKSVYIVCLQKA